MGVAVGVGGSGGGAGQHTVMVASSEYKAVVPPVASLYVPKARRTVSPRYAARSNVARCHVRASLRVQSRLLRTWPLVFRIRTYCLSPAMTSAGVSPAKACVSSANSDCLAVVAASGPSVEIGYHQKSSVALAAPAGIVTYWLADE